MSSKLCSGLSSDGLKTTMVGTEEPAEDCAFVAPSSLTSNVRALKNLGFKKSRSFILSSQM